MIFLRSATNLLIYIFIFGSTPVLAQADAAAVFERAVEAREAGRLDAARQALDESAKLGFAPTRISLERARVDVLAGARGDAIAELQKIAEAGFAAVGVITGDPVLGSLAGDTRYDDLVARMEIVAYPCEHDDAFRAFDFWLGDWDVHLADGTFAGSDTITSEERGCVLVERWQSATGGTGMSINYLDKASDEWVQVWNAGGGSQINIRGGMTDRGMLLTGRLHNVVSGTTAPFRGLWTLLPDGRVRQFFEQSNDDGQTWTTWFEGFYTRRPADEE